MGERYDRESPSRHDYVGYGIVHNYSDRTLITSDLMTNLGFEDVWTRDVGCHGGRHYESLPI